MWSLSPLVSLALFGLVFAFARLLPIVRNYQPALLTLFSGAFLFAVMPPVAVGYLIAFVILSYILLLLKAKSGGRFFMPFIMLITALFMVFKGYAFLPTLVPPLEPLMAKIPVLVGISFVIFRLINLMFEAHEKGEVPGLLNFFNFNLSFLTFLSGPIQRHGDFRAQSAALTDSKPDAQETAYALRRILNGALMVTILAGLFQIILDYVTLKLDEGWKTGLPFLPDETLPSFALVAGVFFYLVFLYYNFAGYSAIAIGLGRLCGFKLPENFNKPFATGNFLDFWGHWHMTLSSWYKDFVFTPILKFTIERGVKNPILAMLPAYFIAFGFVGLWHGRTWPFLFCGAMLAFGAAINHIYRELVAKKIFGKDGYKALKKNGLYHSFSGALTLVYMAMAIIGLQWSGDQILQFLGQTSWAMLALASLCAVFGLGVLLFLFRVISATHFYAALVDRPGRRVIDGQSSFWLGLKLFILTAYALAFLSGVPDIIYQGF